MTDRDPEAEAEDKIEEEKVAAEEEVVQPTDGAFGGGGDWEAAPAGFAGAATGAAATGWDDAAPNQGWDATTGGAQWGDDAAAAPKEQVSQW